MAGAQGGLQFGRRGARELGGQAWLGVVTTDKPGEG